MKPFTFVLLVAYMLLTDFCHAQEDDPYQLPADRLADVLINFSLELKPREKIAISTSFEANDLNIALYKKALDVGAFPTILCDIPGRKEVYYKYANEEQLSNYDELLHHVVSNFDVILWVEANSNLKSMNNVEPKKISLSTKANSEIISKLIERSDNGELRYCITAFPTNAAAQAAEMGTFEYVEFVYNACKLNKSNPAKYWKEDCQSLYKYTKWLEQKEKIKLKGPYVDLEMSVEGRKFIAADGKLNFPDGEIYCSPVENSTNGWIKFTYPVIIGGREIQDLELWIKNGKVQKFKAEKGNELFESLLETDEGAKVIGEIGIGTNYDIKRYTKNILFDEKIGGTIHLAIGQGFSECGGINESSIHIDMVCDMTEGEIIADDEVFYKNGEFLHTFE